jgi:hypothetical protein
MVHYLTQGEAIRHKSLSFMKWRKMNGDSLTQEK